MKIDQKYRPELCVSTDDLRYNLQDPYLDAAERRLVATDGHQLVAIPVEVAEDEPSGFVSRHLLRLARRWFRREFGAASENIPVEIVGDRVPGGPSYPTERDGRPTFCPWKEAMPVAKGAPGTVTIGLDAFLLKTLALALGGEDRRGGTQVQVTFSVAAGKGRDPFRVQLDEDEGALGVLMPCSFSTEHGAVWYVPEQSAEATKEPAAAPLPRDDLREAVYDAVKYLLDRIQSDPDLGYYGGFGTEAFHRLVKAEAAHLGKPLEEVETERRKTAWRGEPRVEELQKRIAELEASRG